MIFQKGDMWKISGSSQKYATRKEAESVLAVKLAVEERRQEGLEEKKKESLLVMQDVLKERAKKLLLLTENSTPFEIMIAKNICTTCNLEPCECFIFTKKTDLGE